MRRVALTRVALTTVVTSALLGGCQHMTAADIKGACLAFDAPAEPVLGKRRVDQRWIDKAVEAGVSACGWSRPRAVRNVKAAL